MTGSFAIRNNWLDLAFVVAFGVLGYYMVKHNYSIIAFVLGIVLGPIAEENSTGRSNSAGSRFSSSARCRYCCSR